MAETKTTTEVLRDEITKNTELKPMHVHASNKAGHIALIPAQDGMVQVIDLKEYEPEFPKMVDETVPFLEISSFIKYVNEHKIAATRIFAQVNKTPVEFGAIIDYHAGTENEDYTADWCAHRATLTLQESDQFKLWKTYSGKFMTQDDFSEFLKDNRLDVFEPNNAELLDLVLMLEATSDSRCVGKTRTNEGMVAQYENTTQFNAGKENVPVPDTLKIRIPLYVGAEPVELVADFKFRVKDNAIKIGYRLLAIDKVLRDAVTGVRDQVQSRTETQVFI